MRADPRRPAFRGTGGGGFALHFPDGRGRPGTKAAGRGAVPCDLSVGELVAHALSDEGDEETSLHLETCERCRDRLECVRRILEVTLPAIPEDGPHPTRRRVLELFPRAVPGEEG